MFLDAKVSRFIHTGYDIIIIILFFLGPIKSFGDTFRSKKSAVFIFFTLRVDSK